MSETRWLVWVEEEDGAPCESRVVTALTAEAAVRMLVLAEAEQFNADVETLPEQTVFVAPFEPRTLRVRVATGGAVVVDEVPNE